MAGFTASGQPSRPYSAPDATGGNAGRTGQMNLGIQGDPDSAATSLDQQSARWNNLTPAQFSAHSVLQQTMPSANGEAAADGARRLMDGTQLPSPNGQSAASYAASLPLLLNGQNSE